MAVVVYYVPRDNNKQEAEVMQTIYKGVFFSSLNVHHKNQLQIT